MSDQNPISLDSQVIARVRQFLKCTNVTQRELCRLIGEKDAANFNSFLSGSKGLAVNKMHRLLQVLSLNKMQLEAKLNKPTMAMIAHFQSANGNPMKLDGDAWVPGQSGSDPDGGSIDDVPTARDLPNADDYEACTIDFLRQQQNLYKSGIQAIEDYISNSQKAKVQTGPSEGPRRTTDNADSSKPGPRNAKFFK